MVPGLEKPRNWHGFRYPALRACSSIENLARQTTEQSCGNDRNYAEAIRRLDGVKLKPQKRKKP